VITGRCLCGDVTFPTDAVPIVTSICCCRLCQYLGASSGRVNIGVLLDGVVEWASGWVAMAVVQTLPASN